MNRQRCTIALAALGAVARHRRGLLGGRHHRASPRSPLPPPTMPTAAPPRLPARGDCDHDTARRHLDGDDHAGGSQVHVARRRHVGAFIPRVVNCRAAPTGDYGCASMTTSWSCSTTRRDRRRRRTITIKGDQMVVESAEVPGQAVLGFKVDEQRSGCRFVSQTRPEYQPGLTEEPIIRMLYTTLSPGPGPRSPQQPSGRRQTFASCPSDYWLGSAGPSNRHGVTRHPHSGISASPRGG